MEGVKKQGGTEPSDARSGWPKVRETMNYFKKMAFVLALVAGLCGGAWAQNWGHGEANHARDNHSWNRSTPEHGRASVPSGNWGYRNNPNYQYRNGEWRNNGNYEYRNGHWGWGPNRTWGGYYPNGNYGYYPNGNYGYYPYGNSGYYPYGGSYPYPTTGGYYPGGWGGNYGYGGGYQAGYRDGFVVGRSDRARGRSYRPAQYKAYKYGDPGYRQGWGRGYNQGFSGF
jgi:hypothetical protein